MESLRRESCWAYIVGRIVDSVKFGSFVLRFALFSLTSPLEMLGIKKLDLYILRRFMPLFAAAFFICLFVFMMQFTWRYVEELIGKGLSLWVLAKFFWYMGITLVPNSLPLAVLLASLITFGNMGEQLELLSMKAAGVSLMRIMRPILLVILLVTGTSFYFQNNIGPQAQIKMRTLLESMKQQSPAVEIPEGVFYSGIPNVNLYVKHKQAETGMLYDVIIYKTDRGFDRAQIVMADSGRLEMTADKMHITLDLWQGEQFENLQSTGAATSRSAAVPYDRESFAYKRLIIDFDSNFNVMDGEALADNPMMKNMSQLERGVDSIGAKMDSVGESFFNEARERWFRMPHLLKEDSACLAKALAAKQVPVFDSLVAQFDTEGMKQAMRTAKGSAAISLSELEWKHMVTGDGDGRIRRHEVFWHQKITYSLACLFFFLIGAPLGAIIRKGGLGLPAVVSVIIFIIYYIIDASGMKMARDGSWNMVYGMWISSVVLLPFGLIASYKANKDSVMFDPEPYVAFFRRLVGWRTKRHLYRKEVIIDDPDYPRMYDEVRDLRERCVRYSEEHRLLLMPGYVDTFFRYRQDHEVEDMAEQVEGIVENLSNTKSTRLLQWLNLLPVLFTRAHVSPFGGRRRNIVAGLIFPLGVVLWLRIWRFRLRLRTDLTQMVKCCDGLLPEIAKYCPETTEENETNHIETENNSATTNNE